MTRSAPSRPSAPPARTRTPRSASPRITSASTRSSPRSNQTKLACDSARVQAELAQPVLQAEPLGEVALDALGHLVGWLSDSSAAACAAALQKNGWRTWSTAVRKLSEPHSA